MRRRLHDADLRAIAQFHYYYSGDTGEYHHYHFGKKQQ
jgi:hypothetical protein